MLYLDTRRVQSRAIDQFFKSIFILLTIMVAIDKNLS